MRCLLVFGLNVCIVSYLFRSYRCVELDKCKYNCYQFLLELFLCMSGYVNQILVLYNDPRVHQFTLLLFQGFLFSRLSISEINQN